MQVRLDCLDLPGVEMAITLRPNTRNFNVSINTAIRASLKLGVGVLSLLVLVGASRRSNHHSKSGSGSDSPVRFQAMARLR